MRKRSIVPLFVVIAVVGTVPLPAAGQAPTDAADSAVALRTPWGAPDLHGVWWGSTITPLERPEGVTNEFLTDEQEAELVQQSSQRNLDWDAGTDLAVLEIAAADITPIALGSTDVLRVGDPAIAVGSPLGLEGGPSLVSE